MSKWKEEGQTGDSDIGKMVSEWKEEGQTLGILS